MITAFTDCDSKSIVLRVPYGLVIDIIQYLPPSQNRDELIEKVRRASYRSSMLSNMLKNMIGGIDK